MIDPLQQSGADESSSARSRAFAETRWSLVRRAQTLDESGRLALAELCERYYDPVHGFIVHWMRDSEKARDATQEFFAALLARPSLGGVEPERGRFRQYLLGAVKHFLSDLRDHEQAEKRGGRSEHQRLDATHEQGDVALEAPHQAWCPDEVFDRRWATTVMQKAWESLRDSQAAEGKSAAFARLSPWLAGPPSGHEHDEVAREAGLSAGAFRVALHRLRQRFREQVRHEVAQTLDPRADVEQEMRELLAILRGR